MGAAASPTCRSPEETLLFGLSEAAPSCAVALRLGCHVEGIGVDPDAPPLVWEAWTADGWRRLRPRARRHRRAQHAPATSCCTCPPTTPTSVVAGLRAGWVRARVVEVPTGARRATPPRRGCAVRRRSPIGRHGRGGRRPPGPAETLGAAEGVAGQRFTVGRTPVLPTGRGAGRRGLGRRDGLAGVDPGARLRRQRAGRPALRPGRRHRRARRSARPCGSRTARSAQYGAVPARGATLRLRAYRTGGGARGQRQRARPRGAALVDPVRLAASATGSPRAAGATPRTSRTPSCEDRWSCAAPTVR